MLQFGALFLWQANCCLMYGGTFWVEYAYGLGWAGSMKVDPRTTLTTRTY